MKAAPHGKVAAMLALLLVSTSATTQDRPPTTEQIGKDAGARRQEAEQQQARDRQKQQSGAQRQSDQQWDDTLRQQRSRDAADSAQGRAVLRSWQQRPPLATADNPLLGRWESQGVGARPSAAGISPEMAKLAASLIGGITGGLCDSMLGRGPVEFRPSGVVAIDRDGREHPMYRAEYRRDGSRVAVLPQGGTSFTHMIVDLDRPGHAMVVGVGCTLTREGGKATVAMAPESMPTANQWALLSRAEQNGVADIYLARSSIQRSGNLSRMWDLMDFKAVHHSEGKPFLSVQSHYEYDCGGSRARMLTATGFAGHMGGGGVTLSSDTPLPWQPTGASGNLRDHWNVACGKG